MLRPVWVAAAVAASPLLLAPPATQKPAPEPAANSWLSPELLRTGFGLISSVGTKGLVRASVDFRPTANIDFRPDIHTGNVTLFGPVQIDIALSGTESAKRREELDARISAERNQIERDKLVVMRDQLAVTAAQAEAARKHLELGRDVFEYNKKRDESLLRRLEYPLRPDKLVVIVADFSAGGDGEGAQVADEVASALTELRELCGIDFEMLVGEIKPGVVVRNERMAADLGQHLPRGSCYAVVWGTLSPRTTGKFRPHVTCVMKASEERGVGQTYTLDLGAQSLPTGQTDEMARRRRHEELVAFTCAAVPGCYAAHELARERSPDFTQLIKYLGAGPESDKLRESLAPLRKWPDARNRGFEYLTRLSRVGPGAVAVNGKPSEESVEYPQAVLNTHDSSVMTLITEPNSARPMLFDAPAGKGKYLAYIDTTETTWRQYLPFYNAAAPAERAGDRWLKVDPAFTNVRLNPPEKPAGDGTRKVKDENGNETIVKFHTEYAPAGPLELLAPDDAARPVINVTYDGAAAYCKYAGKALPLKAEWQAAARAGGFVYPWGGEFKNPERLCACKQAQLKPFPTHPVGGFASTDRSAIGCVDMAGNVAEWCEEFDDNARQRRVVCGGSFADDLPGSFETAAHRNEAPANAQHWIGFRGVVRIPAPAP